jgi:MoxR-like ATPase
MSTQTLPAAVVALTYRQLVDLFRAIGGGTVGFDYSKYKLAELRAILIDWIYVRGAFSAEYVEMEADRVAASATIAPPLPQPSLPAPPTRVAQPAPQSGVPAPFSAPSLQPAPQPTDESPEPSLLRVDTPVAHVPHRQGSATVAAAVPAPAPQPFGVAAPTLPQTVAVQPDERADGALLRTALAADQKRGLGIPVPSAADVEIFETRKPVVAADRTYPHTVHASQVFPEFAAQFPADLFVTLYGHPECPAVDPDYIFHYGHVAETLVALACVPTHRIWLGGPRGTGKTKFAEQIAARTSRPFFRVNFNRATEASEVIGDTGLRNGNTDFVFGPVAAAVVTPGALLLLDELTYGSPGNVASLNALLERKGAHLRLPRTDRTLVPAEGFAAFVADNTFGYGDASGEYAARQIIGSDTRDRISFAIAFDYLSAADEAKLLRAIVQRDTGKKLLKPVAAAIVAVMSVARQTANDGDLPGAPSVRGASAFATLLAFGIPVADAFTSSIVRNAPPESAEKLRQIFAAHWPAELVDCPKFTV